MARSNWVIAGLAIVGVGALVATGFQNVPDSGQVRTGLSDLSQVEQPVVYDAIGWPKAINKRSNQDADRSRDSTYCGLVG